MNSNSKQRPSSTSQSKQKTSSEKESGVARKLGGQPESDREAREAGVSSATDPSPRKESVNGFGHRDEVPEDKKTKDSGRRK